MAMAVFALSFLIAPADNLARSLGPIIKKIPFLPDQIEDSLAFFIVATIASIVCWQGRFDFLTRAFEFNWHYIWEGYITTGAIIASGSSLLKKSFSLWSLAPGFLTGMSSMFGFGGGSATTNATDKDIPPTPPSAPESNQKGDD